jgi:hypothetical protein
MGSTFALTSSAESTGSNAPFGAKNEELALAFEYTFVIDGCGYIAVGERLRNHLEAWVAKCSPPLLEQYRTDISRIRQMTLGEAAALEDAHHVSECPERDSNKLMKKMIQIESAIVAHQDSRIDCNSPDWTQKFSPVFDH